MTFDLFIETPGVTPLRGMTGLHDTVETLESGAGAVMPDEGRALIPTH